jgi:aminoglycoside phosphotransferase (APT) family kinase protein
MVWPEAQIDLDERALRELLDTQFHDYRDLPISRLVAGFDNVLWRLGDERLVRLPRRPEAVPLLEKEVKWLGELAPRLPVPVPVPLRVGEPSEMFPWLWTVTSWFEGTPGDTIDVPSRGSVATQLGEFLRALHEPAPRGVPINPFRGVNLEDRSSAFERRIELARDIVGEATLRDVWNRALTTRPFGDAPTWIHADLHPANLILSHGALAAVVDFGDLCAGDPATDVAGAWMLLPLESIDDFLQSYRNYDQDMVWRALGWAALFGLMFVSLGIQGRESYRRVGERTLRNVVRFAASPLPRASS